MQTVPTLKSKPLALCPESQGAGDSPGSGVQKPGWLRPNSGCGRDRNSTPDIFGVLGWRSRGKHLLIGIRAVKTFRGLSLGRKECKKN